MSRHELTPFLDEIRSRIKLSDLISRHTQVFRKGRSLKALCPFHQEKTPSFNINDDKGLYHCFGCGASGDHFSFIQATQNLSFMETLHTLADQLSIKLPSKESSQVKYGSLGLIEVNEAACIWYQEQLQRSHGEVARHYLNKRQISVNSIKQFRLGYAPPHGLVTYLKNKGFSQETIMEAGLALKAEDGRIFERFRHRLIFPIIGPKNQVIAFGGRIIDQGTPKYLNSPESPLFQKRYVLYGMPQARKHLRDSAIVVEGYMDVIRLHQEGFPYTVAPLGTALSIEHIQQLWQYIPCPIIAFDGDAPGKKAAFNIVNKILPFISAHHTLKVIFLPQGEDPDSFIKNAGKVAFEKLLLNPTPIYILLWQEVTGNLKLTSLSPEELLQVKSLLKAQVSRIAHAELRQAYFQQFDRLLYQLKTRQQLHQKAPWLALPTQTDVNIEKILLVTLVNHPYLWEEVGEQLMNICFKDPNLETDRLELIDYFANNMHNGENMVNFSRRFVNLQKTDQRFYSRAPFARPGYSKKTAKIGWLEAFKKLYYQQLLQIDQQKSAQRLKKDFNLANWEHLKAIKKTLT